MYCLAVVYKIAKVSKINYYNFWWFVLGDIILNSIHSILTIWGVTSVLISQF